MSYLDDTARNAATDAVTALATWVSLHTGLTPTGANELTGGTYARKQTVWGSSATGTATGTPQTVDVPAGNTIRSYGAWTTATAGSLRAGGLLRNSSDEAIEETFTEAGTHTVTPEMISAAKPT